MPEGTVYYNENYGPLYGDLELPGTLGGKGSFSFGDTTRYGPGGTPLTGLPGGAADNWWRIRPGGGGGATIQRRAPGSIFGRGLSYGMESFVEEGSGQLVVRGSSPNGVLIVRLTQG